MIKFIKLWNMIDLPQPHISSSRENVYLVLRTKIRIMNHSGEHLLKVISQCLKITVKLTTNQELLLTGWQ